MIRLSTVLWLVVVVVASFLLYQVKYEVAGIHTQVEATARELEAEKESMHVVAAEWAYLNRPQRLQALSEKYLSTTGVTADKVAEIEAIPMPKHLEAANKPERDDDNIQPASLRSTSSIEDAE